MEFKRRGFSEGGCSDLPSDVDALGYVGGHANGVQVYVYRIRSSQVCWLLGVACHLLSLTPPSPPPPLPHCAADGSV